MVVTLTVASKLSPFPYAAIALANYTKVPVVYDEGVSKPTLSGTTSSDEADIVNDLAKWASIADINTQAQTYFALARTLAGSGSVPDITNALNALDDHLAYRTYLISHQITTADWILYGAVKGHAKIPGLLRNNKQPHVQRWFTHIDNIDTTQAALNALAEAKAAVRSGNRTAASFSMGLEGAVDGQVVTRFPPEPSGYLHIGHAKAALLNQYFARKYHGKLIIRFDDTNPSNETAEFQDTILEDLRLLGVQGDVISYTSDYFDHLYECAIKMIETGKAYADDTVQEQMRDERMNGVESKRRNEPIPINLERFKEMKTGSAEGQRWCLRAKLNMTDLNKAMRDPVIYRCNTSTHHRTGDTWKVYPTYDFACPVVDSYEGVTHALRTNEYRDRNPQYAWMIAALQIRPVHVWDFSRLNFIYTLLSKRKLHWFVNNNHVRGWDDPRFPTVRGIRRRGMTIDALQQFMLQQGPSAATIHLEWDSIWSTNKKVIDPIAPRFWALNSTNIVPVTIKGGPSQPEVKTLPRHKKNPDVGEKQTVFSANILIEQEDAASFDDQEEITLMDWGNAIVRSISRDGEHKVTGIELELHLDGDFRKTKKKVTWLAQGSTDDVTLLDFDYLVTKKKLEEEDNFADFVASPTEFREPAVADLNIQTLTKGDILQFERKGYYIYDGINESDQKREFILIPDGRAASVASKAELRAASSPLKNQNPVIPQMYNVTPVYAGSEPPTSNVNMYKVGKVV